MWTVGNEPVGHRLLQRLQRDGQRRPLRLTHQQIHVLGHDDIAGDPEPVLSPRALQPGLELPLGASGGQPRLTTVATKGDEMEVASFLILL